jgi:hypothetical protein
LHLCPSSPIICKITAGFSLLHLKGDSNMSKSQDAKKETKKKPAKTAKEKKLAKLEKKKK